MKTLATFLAVCSLTFLPFSGCASRQVVPVHDQVLTYDLAMDLTYLRAIEAIEQVPDWVPDMTDKEKGQMRARNTNYSRFDDSDQRVVMIQLTRIDRNKTSVRLAPESQRVVGGDILLAAIDRSLSQEVVRRNS
ncbi:MAG: hypothetical protein WC352_08330 [Candidatus Omnitrophota bacterium]|jgi:hypothetical protein